MIGNGNNSCWLIMSQSHHYLAIWFLFPFLWEVFCSCCWIVWLISILHIFYVVYRSFLPMSNWGIVKVCWSYQQRPFTWLIWSPIIVISWLIGFFPFHLVCYQWSVWTYFYRLRYYYFLASFRIICFWLGCHEL